MKPMRRTDPHAREKDRDIERPFQLTPIEQVGIDLEKADPPFTGTDAEWDRAILWECLRRGIDVPVALIHEINGQYVTVRARRHVQEAACEAKPSPVIQTPKPHKPKPEKATRKPAKKRKRPKVEGAPRRASESHRAYRGVYAKAREVTV